MLKWIVEAAVGPFFNMIISWRKEELKAQGDQANREERLTLKALELDQQEARLNNDRKALILGKWHAPENLFAYFIAFPYWFVAITLDFIVFPWIGYPHVTLPLKGETAAVMGMIMTFWFGKRTINTVAHILADAFGRKR